MPAGKCSEYILISDQFFDHKENLWPQEMLKQPNYALTHRKFPDRISTAK